MATPNKVLKALRAHEALMASFGRYDGSFDGAYVEEEEPKTTQPYPCAVMRYDGSFDGVEIYEMPEEWTLPSEGVLEDISALRGVWLFRA